jgi:hypothetical protein
MLVLKQMLPHSNQISFVNFLYSSNELYTNLMQFHFKQFIVFCGSFSSFFTESFIFTYISHNHEFIFVFFLFQRNKIKYIYLHQIIEIIFNV